MSVTEQAPGWDAIDATLAAAFPGQQPQHWGTDSLPGQAIYGLSAYRDGEHWFFVTFGLSELFAKESDDPTTSGWGFEPTMRTPGTTEPPVWPRRLLQSLGNSVFASGRPFGAGHRADVRQAITGGDPPTRLTAVAFGIDPVLGSIDTPNGRLDFLELVGITKDELDRMQASSTATILSELAEASPTLVTDPAR